ncbi:exodeoxyribonuclease VII small subunit [Pullulanibacillus pueri]|uniref:Exodeoxyribonuclease 7 small subunit n=1 Tax=Pullulanibacillus pueri TaxID=1437324 RepID=A0A8J2ZVN2_9BACL|nr:exodeoxyribonuclease VII small subunit [Pullulanibacillus pueri]MBM7681597.1 exodeoxyribonuclease VII small subunit [Pullulanibacillus pueri]GGH79522.1 exodeoxyribonuclease 7 small subunit [Pullulanibacillus pueri]
MSEPFELETQEENKGEASFEDAMRELEIIVKQLEENEVPLEKAINLFQKGVTLSKTCHQKLQKVEEQMDQILREDGTEEPFQLDKDDQ